jgi:ribosomal protein S18 acetylase RimI-like enzyme
MTSTDERLYEIRTARPEDREGILAIDSSFITSTVFHVAVTEGGFTLREVPVDPPIHKNFPPENADESDSTTARDANHRSFVAVADPNHIVGWCAVSYAPWNRRLTVENIEVPPAHRSRGVGRALMEHAVEFARDRGAGHVWLEVTNINAPAIHAYRRMDFTLCGLDMTLYDSTASEGEQALYMSMSCAPAAHERSARDAHQSQDRLAA